MKNRRTRFFYNGSWTRWFTDDEDMSWMERMPVDKMEVTEEMTKDEYVAMMKRYGEPVDREVEVSK